MKDNEANTRQNNGKFTYEWELFFTMNGWFIEVKFFATPMK